MTLVEPQPIMLLQVGGQQTGQSLIIRSPCNCSFPAGPIISFNEWLDAVDGSYCTSDGGDDFTYDPTIPNPFPGGLTEHTCGIIQPPNVVSNSQADHEYRFSQFYLQRQCNEFAKLGLMGVTIIYSAGNAGVSGAQSGVCLDQNGMRRPLPRHQSTEFLPGSMNRNATKFNPAWPASCPWVTAVGGTQVKANTSVSDLSAEEVWNEEIIPGAFESGGGGFSNRFPTPDYQKDAVKSFLDRLEKTDPAHSKNFNSKGVSHELSIRRLQILIKYSQRAFPDLSANS
jgi:tripeptidyl-peptidase-1